MKTHHYEKHKACELTHCQICDGGLLFCIVCRCGESELTTECPGDIPTDERRAATSRGELDFKNGEWIAS